MSQSGTNPCPSGRGPAATYFAVLFKYLSALVQLYLRERLPDLPDVGQSVPPLRNATNERGKP